ncbi:rCG58168, partial [Rattus norvegicus]
LQWLLLTPPPLFRCLLELQPGLFLSFQPQNYLV